MGKENDPFEDADGGVLARADRADVAFVTAVPAWAQSGWKPSRSVMFIAPNAVGGTSDRAARTPQRVMQALDARRIAVAELSIRA